jgi:DNA-binding response OmpR family regulator
MPGTTTIMVVEDDRTVSGLIGFILGSEGFQVLPFYTGRDALDAFEQVRPDLIILDLMMPGMTGFEFAQAVRAKAGTRRLPILVVTASDQVSARYEAFQAGADDFVTKPFDAQELLFRVRAFLRLTTVEEDEAPRPQPAAAPEPRVKLNLVTMMATLDGRQIQLTRLESLVLQHLLVNPNRILSADDITQEVLAAESGSRSADAAQAHVKNLRQKLEVDPSRPTLIVTVGRRGYRYMGG